MTMKTRTITEDVAGSLNRRYFAELEVGDELEVKREGDTPERAARNVMDTIRYWADDVERKFVETGVMPRTARKS